MKIILQEYINKGVVLLQKKNYLFAEKIFLEALKKFPNQHSLYTYLIPCLIHQFKYNEALKFATNFHQLGTMMETSSIYLGTINFLLSNLKESFEYFKIALSINPKNCHALINQAAVLNKLDQNKEAKNLLEKALLIDKNSTAAYKNFATIFEDELQFDKAQEFYLKALKINPNDQQALYALGQIQLSNNDYEKGWKNYEHRWYRGDLVYRYPNIPKLSLDDCLVGKKVLVWHEQGFGDTIQFSRYVRQLIKLQAVITFEVQKPLVDFLQDQFDCEITSDASNIKFDYQSPLLSLPLIFGANVKHFEFIGSYFKTKKDRVLFWKNRLKIDQNNFNLGITISGNTKQVNEIRRRINLDYFLKFIKYGKIFIIQKELTEPDRKIMESNQNFIFLGYDKNWLSFDDTSAIVENMDFIITVDTSIIHLAGSMNKKSLLLLSKPAEWRWTQNNNTMPNWYDSVKILRQQERRRWDTIMNDIELQILKCINQKNEKNIY